MFELYKTPVDILYLIISIGGGVLLFFLIIAVFHLMMILSNVRKISSKAKDTMDLVNHYMWQPIKIMMMVIEKAKEVAAKQAKQTKKARKGGGK